MRIAVACDHRGYEAKRRLIPVLKAGGHAVEDLGCEGTSAVDYPDYAAPGARAVAEGRADVGILMDGSGIGMSVVANKVHGVRAALCGDAATADGARRWNDANVLALSLRTASPAVLGEILDAWFAAGPSAEPDDAAKIAHLTELERG